MENAAFMRFRRVARRLQRYLFNAIAAARLAPGDPLEPGPGIARKEMTMSSPAMCVCALALFGFAASPVMAQTADTAVTPHGEPALADPSTVFDAEPPVIQYDLDGPRIGLTFMPNGAPRTQFGWHVENQASPGSRGPWFLVERIFLIGGVEKSEFIPTGTLIFGVRTPSSSEVGVGPSVSIGRNGLTTAIVVAGGQTLRYGGVRVPINVALAMSQREHVTAVRLTVITGWAIRQPEHRPVSQPYRYGLER